MFLDLSYSSNAMFIFVFHARQELNILASTADNKYKTVSASATYDIELFPQRILPS